MPEFAQLTRAFLVETAAESPVLATHLGIDGFDDQLDDLSEAAFERRSHRNADWLQQFQAVDADALTFDEGIDRELILSVLRGRAIMDDWQMWRRQPDTYLAPGLSGVFALFLHRLKPVPELARAAAARMRAVPRLVADGKRNLRPELAPALYVERALGQARAGVTYFRELVPVEVDEPWLCADLAEAGAIAGDACADFVAFLEDLRTRAHGAWAIGEERYTRLLRQKEMLPDDARSLRERGRAEYERLAEELRRCARAIANTDDWPGVLTDFNKDHPPTPEDMRQTYSSWTERARQFLKEHHLVSFPDGEECTVEPSPVYQRPVLAVASYQSPPPFSSSLKGHFFVPYPPDGAPPDEVQKRLENNSYAGIPTTAVHETYPGHHWHLVTAHGQPSAVRRTFRTPYFSEGWGLYAEHLMREQGFFTDPRQEMSQYEAIIFRAARVVVDTSLHIGDMTVDEAVAFMMERSNLPEPTAQAEVRRYCSWPTQASSYLTGYLEILRIRDRYRAAHPGDGIATLRSFHDSLAGSGGPPLALAERAVLESPSPSGRRLG
jgi:uncharacterized protein (DUF885 family)